MTAGDQTWPLIAGLAVLCWAVVAAYARPTWIVGLAMALLAYEATFGAVPGVEVAGTAVYARDAVFLVILTAGAMRVAMRKSRPERKGVGGWAWRALLLLVSLSLVRGLQSYGANLAGNDFRPTFYVLAGVIGVATWPRDSTCVRDVVDMWIGAALLLVAIGMARAVGVTIGLPVDEQPFLNGRPLYAWPTLVIAQAALLSFFAVPLKSRWAAVPGLPYVFVIAVVLFRHRTVWATMVIALVAMWTVLRPDRAPGDKRVDHQWSGIVVAAGVLVLVLLTGKGASLERDLTASTRTATAQDSTFLWRVEGWKALLRAQKADPQDLVLGIPYGAGYHREVFDAEVEYSPHSWYVQTVSRIGALGCGFLIIVLAQLFRRGRAQGLLPRNLGALLVLSAAVYGIAYYPPEVEGILLGLVTLAAGPVRRDAPSAEGSELAPVPRSPAVGGLVPLPR